MTQEALKKMYQLLLTEPHAPTVCAHLERIAREALAEHAMSETQRLGQEIEQCKYPDCKCPTENPCLKGLAQPEQKPVAREHVTDSSKCWCDPELDYKDPDTGVEVWVHRSKQ